MDYNLMIARMRKGKAESELLTVQKQEKKDKRVGTKRKHRTAVSAR